MGILFPDLKILIFTVLVLLTNTYSYYTFYFSTVLNSQMLIIINITVAFFQVSSLGSYSKTWDHLTIILHLTTYFRNKSKGFEVRVKFSFPVSKLKCLRNGGLQQQFVNHDSILGSR